MKNITLALVLTALPTLLPAGQAGTAYADLCELRCSGAAACKDRGHILWSTKQTFGWETCVEVVRKESTDPQYDNLGILTVYWKEACGKLGFAGRVQSGHYR